MEEQPTTKIMVNNFFKLWAIKRISNYLDRKQSNRIS